MVHPPELPTGSEETMSYPSGHRPEVKKRIVARARRLFNRHGFEGVSVDTIMAGAGLTRGGFYSYFESKSALYAEVLGCFFTDPEWQSCWDGVEVDLAARDAGPQVVRAYLSRQHYEDVENSCPMVALPTDVSRSDKRTRHAFETIFAAMVSVLERSIAGSGARANGRGARTNGGSRRGAARSIAALCVGGMVVARALENRASADALRDACMEAALRLGGWKTVKTRRR
jgi:AcrR family transcriptional regulator